MSHFEKSVELRFSACKVRQIIFENLLSFALFTDLRPKVSRV